MAYKKKDTGMLTKRDNTLHLKVSDDVHAALEMLADMQGKDRAQLAAELLEELLLGRAHAARVLATRYAAALNSGRRGA